MNEDKAREIEEALEPRRVCCFNCSTRLPLRAMVEVLEEDHLTWFGGELLCPKCADATGVLR